MKQSINAVKSSFTDYAGKSHDFVVVAIVSTFKSDNLQVTSLGNTELKFREKIKEGIQIGVSICNPEDKFNDDMGLSMAKDRALQSEVSLYSTDNGHISPTLIKALIFQEVEFIKSNPGKYIKGYNEAKERYFKRKEMAEINDSLNETERGIIKRLSKDAEFSDKVIKYVTWLENQEQVNKCKKA